MCFDEEFYGKGLEWKDARIERDTEGDDIPVRRPEFEDVIPHHFFGRSGLSHLVFLFSASLQDPIDNRSDNAHDAKDDADKEGPPPVLIRGRSPRRRVESSERPESRDGKVHPERETELLALEPLCDRGRHRDYQGFGAESENEPACGHGNQRVAQCGDDRSEKAKESE